MTLRSLSAYLALLPILVVLQSAAASAQTAAQPTAPAKVIPLKAIQMAPAQSVQGVPVIGLAPSTAAPAIQVEQNGEAAAATPAAAAAAQDPALAAREQQHIQQLNSLELKRTPSAILDAWKAKELPASPPPDTAQPSESSEPLPGGEQPASTSPPVDPNNPLTWLDDNFQKYTTELQQNFALSRWAELGQQLKLLPEAQRKPLLVRMLNALGTDTPMDELTRLRMQSQQRGMDPRVLEKQRVSFDDVFSLARLFDKRPLEDSTFEAMGRAFASAIQQGRAREELVSALTNETARPEAEQICNRNQAAKLLVAASELDAATTFLPTLDDALKANDFEALTLLSKIFAGEYDREPKTATLEKAWNATLAVLAGVKSDGPLKLTAITQALDLATKVRKELGQEWLENSFTAEPTRGIAILSGIGSESATALTQSMFEEERRLQLLKLQTSAVEALLKANPTQASQWKEVLELLASNWLREVPISYTDDLSTTFGPQMRRDLYGNIFYYDESMGDMQMRGQRVNPIRTAELIDVRPSEGWVAQLDPSLQPKYWFSIAQLYLKVGQESLALPFIEKLGQSHPRLSKALVREFLTVWTKNHNPNSEKQKSNPYMFMYGFESKAESIPLTRSKQVRNLEELSQLVPKLRQLNGEELDPELLVGAFLTSHSFAEVYKTEDLEKVFGPMDQISPKVIASLGQKMREGLASVWREVEVQKQAKTKRNRKEVEAEVVAGYKAANQLMAKAAEKHPDDPGLLTLQAALLHDENGYQAELKSSPEFAPRRRAAFDVFHKAADAYARQVSSLDPNQRNTDVYERWFYASLGACDLKLVDERQVPDETQYKQIADAINGLPAPHAEWHLARFANLIFTRMSNAKPSVKSRYLRGGFSIVGDHPQARDARAVFDYYNDLVSEIKLETQVDGTDRVGTAPFGVYVNLLHTREIERESGGFGRYLTNQNANNMFAYNYGRPLENYRDKFEEFVRNALQEHFDILSVTFQVPDVNSRSAQPEGWRRTPYAYLLLKSRGPQVDRLPPLKLDLDFLDTTGYAILPIESPALPLDCAVDKPEPRPFKLRSLTQILDERQADKGELLIEVKAAGEGLLPALETILTKLEFPGFQLGDVEDNGVSVTRFDAEATDNVVLSERGWVLHLKSDPATSEQPETFAFAAPAVEAGEVVYQRYKDADLKTEGQTVQLTSRYAESLSWKRYWPWGLGGLAALGLLGWGIRSALRSGKTVAKTRELPEELTPFQAIQLLQEVERNSRLDSAARADLRKTIADLELRFFDDNAATPLNPIELRAIAQQWLSSS
jgi:hypothetical protein